MRHVGRIGNLHAGDAESGLRRSQTEEAHQHSLACHDPIKQTAHFDQTLFPVQGCYTWTEIFPLSHEITGMRLIPGLIMQATVFKRIKMDGVAGVRKRPLFTLLQSKLADQFPIFKLSLHTKIPCGRQRPAAVATKACKAEF